MGGWDTVMRFAQLAAEKNLVAILLLVTLEGESVQKWGMTDVFTSLTFFLFGCR